MKAITILVTILITFASCNCQKKTVEATSLVTNKQTSTMKLVYEANTRGFYQKITIYKQELFVSKDRNSTDDGKVSKISDTNWNELQSFMTVLNLDELANYKDPTQKRFYDGAAIANLKVMHNDKEYRTTDFDNGFPPVEIEKLVTKITLLAKE